MQADYTSVAMNQIELDLYRTLPTHKHYKTDGEWVCCVYCQICVFIIKKNVVCSYLCTNLSYVVPQKP